MKKSKVFFTILFLVATSVDFVSSAKRPGYDLSAQPQPIPKVPRTEDGQANVHGAVPSTADIQQFPNQGLINSNSNCFLNSALQVLFALPEFRAFLVKHKDSYFDLSRATDEIPGDYLIPGALIDLFDRMNASHVALRTEDFRKSICLNGSDKALREMLSNQHDSGEFITCILSNLQNNTIFHHQIIKSILDVIHEKGFNVEANFFVTNVILPALSELSDFGKFNELHVDALRLCLLNKISNICLRSMQVAIKNAFATKDMELLKKLLRDIQPLIPKVNGYEENIFYVLSDLLELSETFGCNFFDVVNNFLLIKHQNLKMGLLTEDVNLLLIGQWISSFRPGFDIDNAAACIDLFCSKISSLNIASNDKLFESIDIQELQKIVAFLSGEGFSPIMAEMLTDPLNMIKQLLKDLNDIFGVHLISPRDDRWTLKLDLLLPPVQPGKSKIYLNELISHLEMQDIKISSMPRVLIVQLPLFAGDFDSSRDLKSGQKIPESLHPATATSSTDFSIKVGDVNCTYRLVGVIYHSGHDIESGHYVAVTSNTTGNWFFYDDCASGAEGYGDVRKLLCGAFGDIVRFLPTKKATKFLPLYINSYNSGYLDFSLPVDSLVSSIKTMLSKNSVARAAGLSDPYPGLAKTNYQQYIGIYRRIN